MSEKEYIVTLKKDVDYEAFNQEMIKSTGDGAIPNRSAPIANARPGSKRNTHYMLTDEEATALNSDPRVDAVELRPDLRDDIELVLGATQTGNFTKTDSDTGDFINWGLRRCNEATDPYVGNDVTGGYDYTLDGTGVDFVIHDSGLQVDHPEFEDADGVSRVQLIDWYDASGLPGTQSENHYRDFDGHGTHVAGTVAGKTYGWAKNARIYCVKVGGLEGSGDSGGIPISDCFDVVKLWHRNKPVDPVTGVKRPTVVNMSWGYGGYFVNVTGGVYRGTPWSGSRDETKGMLGAATLFGYRHVVRVASVDADLQELIDEGVHVCISAGNSKQKIDVPGGVDYDNYFTSTSYVGARYYHRGGSPYSEDAMIVGNVDAYTTVPDEEEQKAESSETGPGVTVWAPGTNVMSSTSTTNRFTDGVYPADTNFRICNISGTSMASPQVAGVLSLYLQLNPESTPTQSQTWLVGQAKNGILFDTGEDDDWLNNRSLKGGNNRFLFNKFNSAIQMTLGSGS
jgi:subtilisin family serine protease